jgi:hypothetical protein
VWALAGAVAAATVASGTQAAGTEGTREEFSAFAVNLSNISSPRGNAGTVDIVVERWSTDEERERLTSTFVEQGPQRLLRELQKVKPRVGYIRTSTSLGYDLRFAWQKALPDGARRIYLVTDRPIGFWEARDQPRTVDYPFTLIEMRVDAEGRGEGKVSVATKITLSDDRKTVELENYASQPVRLNEIRRRG